MDNLTHSLVGYAVAKAAKFSGIKNLKEKFENKRFSNFFIFVSVFAANFSDIDLVYSLYDSSPLSYFIHHRGFTHTFLMGLPQAIFVLITSALCFRIKDKTVLAYGFGLITVNIFLHIISDGLNSYGVHPFFPWDNHWFYGDRIFIIEPLIWFSILPLILVSLKNKSVLKNVLILFFITVVFLAFYLKMLSLGTAFILILYFISLVVLFYRLYEPTRVLVSWCFTAIIVLGFIMEGLRVENLITAEFSKHEHTGEKLEDLVLSPFPGNFFCWSVFAVRTAPDDVYSVAVGKIQSLNVLGFKCPEGMTPEMQDHQKTNSFSEREIVQGYETAKVDYEIKSKVLKEIKSVQWLRDYRGSKSKIFDDHHDCRLQNWFQFVRVPYLNSNGDYLDLRFSHVSDRGNFTRMNLKTDQFSCVKMPAPWIRPTKKLFFKVSGSET